MNLHTQRGQDALKIGQGAEDLILSGRHSRQIDLTADLVCLLVDIHFVTPEGSNSGSFQTGNARAHNDHLLLAFAGLDGHGGFLAIFGIQYAGDVTAVLDGIHTTLVAVQAQADGLAGFCLVGDIGIAQQAAAVSNDIGIAVLQNFFAVFDGQHLADGGNRNGNRSLDGLGHGQNPVIFPGTHGRNGIGHVAGVVCLSHLNHVDTGLFQQLGKFHSILRMQAALAPVGAVGIFGNDGQLVLDHQIGSGFLDGSNHFQRIADPVFEAAAVLIGTEVHQLRAQRTQQAVAVDFDGIDAGFLRPAGSIGDVTLDLGQLRRGHFLNEVLHVIGDLAMGLSAKFAGFLHLGAEGCHVALGLGFHAFFRCHLGQTDQAAHLGNVILGVENLQSNLAVVLVQGIGQSPEGRNLAVIAELGGGRCGHNGSYVTQDHKAGAALGQALIEGQTSGADGAVPLLVTGGQRREHDAVFESQIAHLDGLQQQGFFAHDGFPLSVLFMTLLWHILLHFARHYGIAGAIFSDNFIKIYCFSGLI